MIRPVIAILLTSLLVGCGGQRPDKSFRPTVTDPADEAGAGLLDCLDEAHDNSHTLHNRF